MNDSDLAFYHDQSSSRICKCLSVVENPSSSDVNFQKRVSQKQIRCDTEVQSSVIEKLDLESNASDPGPLSSSLSDFSPQQKRMKLIEDSQQNRQSLKNLALMCEKYQISDRAVAAIGSATLKDFGVVTDYDASLVIDISKLKRERQKYWDAIRKAEEGLFGIVGGIYIDGRKDATLVVTKSDGKMYTQIDLEEHM